MWCGGGGVSASLILLTEADGTRVLLRHLSVGMMLIDSEGQPDPQLSHPKAASSLFEPTP